MILRLTPIFKNCYWGGEKLKEIFEDEIITQATDGFSDRYPHLAEVWEFACHMDGVSKLSPAPSPKPTGDIMTLSLSGLNRKKLFGSLYKGYANFPFSVKLADSAMDLPLQVNPDNEFANLYEHQQGRNEIWYIMDCEENSEIIYGFKEKISPEMFKTALTDNTVISLVKKTKVKKGDVFFIKPGIIYAVGKGITLASVHESSNASYTVYDYNRLNEVGLLRQMQTEKALQVMTFEPAEDYLPSAPVDGIITLGKTSRYTAKVAKITNFLTIEPDGDSFHNVVILEGEGNISDIDEMLPVRKGDTFFIPASGVKYTLYGELKVLITYMTSENG
ncbi:MAG: class I mannose-6-phosphate isomerase [Oscillospiraceae bacterium]|nr:class I mannose-6-phosphate isomerase [Oscillospiraceae bacterium]